MSIPFYNLAVLNAFPSEFFCIDSDLLLVVISQIPVPCTLHACIFQQNSKLLEYIGDHIFNDFK